MEGGVGEASSTEVPCEEGLEEESMCEEDHGDVDDEDVDEKSENSSSPGSMQESSCSTHCYSDRCHCPHSSAEQSKLGSGGDGSLGELSASQDSGGKGESKVGHPPALPFPLLHEQESSSELPGVTGQAAPGGQRPWWATSHLQAARKQSSSML